MSSFDNFRQFVRRNVPLAMYTRIQLGGPAEFFAEPAAEEDLAALLQHCRSEGVHVRLLGSGTNILVSEKGVPGLVLSLASPAFCGISTDERGEAVAGAGAKLGRVITQSAAQGLEGLEGLLGIPGTVGGAVCGNTGTNGGDIGQWVESITVMDIDGNVSVLTKNDITFGYRSSSLEDGVILSVTFSLDKGDPAELTKRMQKLWIVRKTRQPLGEQPSVYAFKNPRSGMSAEELIEQAGLKGTRIGGAMINERNAQFISAEPECSTDDVLRLIELVQQQVEKRSDAELETAIEIW